MGMRVHRQRCLMIGFALCIVFGLVSAQESEKEWTRQLSMKYKSIRETAMSPDGKLIAYVVREPLMEGEKSEYRSHIWVVSTDGKENVQYTQGEKSCSNPAFSPDGDYLAFTSSRSEKSQVWMMRVRGGEAEQVTEAKSDVASFQWSPDGKYIAYTMIDPETEEDEKKEKEKRDVILVDRDFKYSHLYIIPTDRDEKGERKAQRLTSGEFHVTDFDFTPDGKMLVFAHQPDPRINTGFLECDISTVPADSGTVVALVDRPGVDTNPLVSPDGKWVAFASHGGRPEAIGLRDLYIVPMQGGEPVKLADTPDRNVRILGWSRDSKAIYVTEFIGTSIYVLAVPASGDAPQTVTQGDGVFGSVSLDKNARQMAFTYEDCETPADIYTSPIRKFRKVKLTDLHGDVPKPPMGRTEKIRWTSEDGLEIEGLLTYPVNYQAGTTCPLILQIHGGPAGVFGRSFTGGPAIYMTQYFAQHGYAVLRPNPRGSTGYGKEFRYANVLDWGFGDFQDCMSGVDKVIEMGVGHPDSLCVMGWSYGGYLTSYTVTKTGRFKAASIGAGLPNLVSMVTTTDIPDYLVAHMNGEFWEDYATYEKHSAIYRIKNVSTPTQVIHGQQDIRVPFTQGQEFYVALQRLGVPTEMVVYPRTPHGPREPKFLMDVSYRILKWFEKHVRGCDFEEKKAPESSEKQEE